MQSHRFQSQPQSTDDAPTDDALILTALLRAGDALGIAKARLAEMIGRPSGALSRKQVVLTAKEQELALLVVRVYRALFPLVDGNPRNMRHWLNTPNQALCGTPAEMMLSIVGLTRVCQYLDGMRGKI